MQDQSKMFLITLAAVLGLIYLGWNFFSPKFDEPTSEKMVKESFEKLIKAYYPIEMEKLVLKKEKNMYVYEGDIDSVTYGKKCIEHCHMEFKIKANPFKVIIVAEVYFNGFFAGQFDVDLKNNIIS